MTEYYLCAGNTVIGSFSTSKAALGKTRFFAVGVHVKIKKTHDDRGSIVGQSCDNSQKSQSIYRRRLKPGDFRL